MNVQVPSSPHERHAPVLGPVDDATQPSQQGSATKSGAWLANVGSAISSPTARMESDERSRVQPTGTALTPNVGLTAIAYLLPQRQPSLSNRESPDDKGPREQADSTITDVCPTSRTITSPVFSSPTSDTISAPTSVTFATSTSSIEGEGSASCLHTHEEPSAFPRNGNATDTASDETKSRTDLGAGARPGASAPPSRQDVSLRSSVRRTNKVVVKPPLVAQPHSPAGSAAGILQQPVPAAAATVTAMATAMAAATDETKPRRAIIHAQSAESDSILKLMVHRVRSGASVSSSTSSVGDPLLTAPSFASSGAGGGGGEGERGKEFSGAGPALFGGTEGSDSSCCSSGGGTLHWQEDAGFRIVGDTPDDALNSSDDADCSHHPAMEAVEETLTANTMTPRVTATTADTARAAAAPTPAAAAATLSEVLSATDTVAPGGSTKPRPADLLAQREAKEPAGAAHQGAESAAAATSLQTLLLRPPSPGVEDERSEALLLGSSDSSENHVNLVAKRLAQRKQKLQQQQLEEDSPAVAVEEVAAVNAERSVGGTNKACTADH